MLDRITLHAAPSSVSVSVTEKRAPTDESVRLLKEMETAALKKLEQSINVGNNGFECVIHTYRDAANDSVKFIAHFAINGKKMTFRDEIRSMDCTPETVCKRLVTGIAEQIAIHAIGIALSPSLFK